MFLLLLLCLTPLVASQQLTRAGVVADPNTIRIGELVNKDTKGVAK